ncbi:hypothetical protein ACXR0O_07665 [Verrucomicrobiota bacterium sgz303538]
MKRLLLLLLSCVALVPAHGQLAVGLNIKRRMHMLYEPMLATVTITNNSGRELMLDDAQQGQWFSFTITTQEGRTIPPRNPDYKLEPLQLQPGETAKRTVNLTELYQLADYGMHKVRANILLAGLDKYFSSNSDIVELTEGRVIWKQTVGVPSTEVTQGDASRTFTLLTLEHDDGKYLYVRVIGADDGVVYGCYSLGKLIEGAKPEPQFDRGNNLWVLQLVGQKTYFLSKIGIGGDFQAQSTYITPKSKPFLRKLADGTLQMVGAVRQERVATQDAPPVPKLSDRPAGLPK